MLEYAQIIAIEYSWILAWWLICLFTGSAFIESLQRLPGVSKFEPPNIELNVFFSMSAGIAIQITVLIVLASLHWLTPVFVLGAAILMLGASAWIHLRSKDLRLLRQLWRPLKSEGLINFLPLALLIFAWFLRPLGPAILHDEVSYHLPYARFYLEQGGLAVQEFLRFPLQAHNFNLLYVLALMRNSISMAHLMSASAGFLCLIGVHGMARHWFGGWAAFIAVLAVLASGAFQDLLKAAYVDLGSMLFVAAAMLCLALWSENRNAALVLLGGVFLGTAMGTKYIAGFFAVPLGLWVLWCSRNSRDFISFTLMTCAFGLFWYLRSWWISGDPVHPFGGQWFGYYIWSAEDLRGQITELHKYGIGRTLFNFVRLPEQLLFNKNVFHGTVWLEGALLGVFYLGLLAVQKMRPAMRVLALISLLYLVFWFCTSQVPRYFLPIIPAMALVAAFVFAQISSWMSQRRAQQAQQTDRKSKEDLVIMISIASLLCLYQIDKDLSQIPIRESTQQRELVRLQPGYKLFLAAAADPRIGNGPLLQFNLEGSYFYFLGTLYGDWMGRFAYSSFREISDEGQWEYLAPRAFREKLREHGIRGVVFYKDPSRWFYPSDMEAYKRVFEPIFENEFGIVLVPRD